MPRWLILIPLALGCVTTPQSPAERWFLARATYTAAKEAAVECMRTDPSPCRDVAVATRIVAAMERGDALIRDTEALYLISTSSHAERALDHAVARLAGATVALEEATP